MTSFIYRCFNEHILLGFTIWLHRSCPLKQSCDKTFSRRFIDPVVMKNVNDDSNCGSFIVKSQCGCNCDRWRVFDAGGCGAAVRTNGQDRENPPPEHTHTRPGSGILVLLLTRVLNSRIRIRPHPSSSAKVEDPVPLGHGPGPQALDASGK